MEEVLRPVVEFRRYKVADSAAVREFYSLLRAAIKGAKGLGRLSLLINDQTIPRIMGKMPYTDWKEWATRRPEWMQEDLSSAFEGFVERKWQDALNIAAAEPSPWVTEREKTNPSKGPLDKTAHASKGASKMSGIVNVVNQQPPPPRQHSPTWDVSSGRRCRARYLVGCDGDHVILQCAKLLELNLEDWKEVLKQSGLCLYSLKHAAEVECYGQGGFSKPRCMQAGCDGEHTMSLHKLLGEGGASVNLVAEDECESGEDKEWWVGTVRVEGGSSGEMDDSELESEGAQYDPRAYVEENASELEDGLKHFPGAPNPLDACKREEKGWGSSELTELSAGESEKRNSHSWKRAVGSPLGPLKKRSRPARRRSRGESSGRKGRGTPVGAGEAECLAEGDAH
jgi:hypothetical protein